MPKSSTTVLGIDPGIARLGYAVVRANRDQLALGAYGVFETPKGFPTGSRLHKLHASLHTLIAKHRPQRIAVEQLFFSNNAKTAIVIGEVRGVILLAAAEHSVPIAEFSPLAVKLSLTGSGRAEKRQVQRMLQAMFHLRSLPTPDDAADAIAIAVCGTAGLAHGLERGLKPR